MPFFETEGFYINPASELPSEKQKVTCVTLDNMQLI
jgi:hypothetical protein